MVHGCSDFHRLSAMYALARVKASSCGYADIMKSFGVFRRKGMMYCICPKGRMVSAARHAQHGEH